MDVEIEEAHANTSAIECGFLAPDISPTSSDKMNAPHDLVREPCKTKHSGAIIKGLHTQLIQVQKQLVLAVAAEQKKSLMLLEVQKGLKKLTDDWEKQEVHLLAEMKFIQAERDAAVNELEKLKKALINANLASKQMESRWQQLHESAAKEVSIAKQEVKDIDRKLHEESSKVAEMKSNFLRLNSVNDKLVEEVHQLLCQLDLDKEKLRTNKEEFASLLKSKIRADADRKEEIEKRFEAEETLSKIREAYVASETKSFHLSENVEILTKEKAKLQGDLDTAQMQLQSLQQKLEEFHHKLKESMNEAEKRISSREAALVSQYQASMTETQKTQTKILQQYEDVVKQMEIEYVKVVKELTLRIKKAENEVDRLRQSKMDLERYHQNMTTKLRALLGNQWNQIVALIGEYPKTIPTESRDTSLQHMNTASHNPRNKDKLSENISRIVGFENLDKQSDAPPFTSLRRCMPYESSFFHPIEINGSHHQANPLLPISAAVSTLSIPKRSGDQCSQNPPSDICDDPLSQRSSMSSQNSHSKSDPRSEFADNGTERSESNFASDALDQVHHQRITENPSHHFRNPNDEEDSHSQKREKNLKQHIIKLLDQEPGRLQDDNDDSVVSTVYHGFSSPKKKLCDDTSHTDRRQAETQYTKSSEGFGAVSKNIEEVSHRRVRICSKVEAKPLPPKKSTAKLKPSWK